MGVELITWLAINNTGYALRSKITEFGGPKESTAAAVIVKIKDTAVLESRWAVWGKGGYPELYTSNVSPFTTKGKP